MQRVVSSDASTFFCVDVRLELRVSRDASTFFCIDVALKRVVSSDASTFFCVDVALQRVVSSNASAFFSSQIQVQLSDVAIVRVDLALEAIVSILTCGRLCIDVALKSNVSILASRRFCVVSILACSRLCVDVALQHTVSCVHITLRSDVRIANRSGSRHGTIEVRASVHVQVAVQVDAAHRAYTVCGVERQVFSNSALDQHFLKVSVTSAQVVEQTRSCGEHTWDIQGSIHRQVLNVDVIERHATISIDGHVRKDIGQIGGVLSSLCLQQADFTVVALDQTEQDVVLTCTCRCFRVDVALQRDVSSRTNTGFSVDSALQQIIRFSTSRRLSSQIRLESRQAAIGRGDERVEVAFVVAQGGPQSSDFFFLSVERIHRDGHCLYSNVPEGSIRSGSGVNFDFEVQAGRRPIDIR